ncbi:RNA ligase family protein [Catenuloplanes sp. NPDC051500]|uniref:RNA ligase family protein n=1 Tax=Catenuloplanes sp. NPDC051500 TaxID=3363959 RepID=UPI003791BEA3
MNLDVRTTDLRALNSLTKYPSIPTYHELDPKNGGLLDTAVPFTGPVLATEKVDGTNSRIIQLPGGDYLLGSREELLYARGDLIGNPSQGIVENLKPLAEALPPVTGDLIRVLYLELYGGKIGGHAKQYSTRGAIGWRLFDAALISGYAGLLAAPPQEISAWRESGGQPWADEDALHAIAAEAGVELTPRLFTLDAAELPTDLEKMQALLTDRLPATLVALDESGGLAAEGIVFRTPDRAVIAKARFQDYARTFKRRNR